MLGTGDSAAVTVSSFCSRVAERVIIKLVNKYSTMSGCEGSIKKRKERHSDDF